MAEVDEIPEVGQTPPPQTPQPPPDKVRALYDAVSHDYDLGDFDTFKQKLQDPEKQKAFYNGVGKDYDLGSFEEFQGKVSGGKSQISQPQKTASDYPGFGSQAFTLPPEEHEDADKTINSALNTKEANAAIDKAATDAYLKNNQIPVDQHSENQPVSKPNVVIPKEILQQSRDAFKEVTHPQSEQARTILEDAKRTSKNPEFAAKINKAYLIKDRNGAPNPDVLSKVNSGKYGYDLLKQRPTVELNAGQSFIKGIEDHYNNVQKADDLADKSKEDIIAGEEADRANGAKNNQDTPIETSNGWASSIANMAGENATSFGKAALGGTIAAATGGTAAPLLGTALGTLFMSHDAGKQAAGATFTSVYNDLRNKGFAPEDAYDHAIEQAKFNGASAAGQMALMSYAGLKGTTKPLGGAVYGKGFKTFLKSQAENIPQIFKNAGAEAGKIAPIAAGFKALENLNAGKPVGDNVAEAAAGAGMFVAALHTLGSARQSLAPRATEVALNGFANSNPELVEQGINQLQVQKDLTPEEADKLRSDIKAQRELNKGLPENVPEANKQKIKDLIDKRTDLENKIDPDHPDFVDKAYHADIKEEINGVKKEKADGTTEGKDGINEKIRQLSEPQKESPNFHEDEIYNKPDLTATLSNVMKKNFQENPDKFLKEVADHAQGGVMFEDNWVSSRPGAVEQYGEPLVKAAEEKYPEHTLSSNPVESSAAKEPEYLTSRHADTVKDEEGKVSGPNEHPLSKDGRKDANDLANEVSEHAKQTGVPVTKIVHSSLERAKETGDKVAEKTGAKTVSDKGLDTWDIGQFDDVKDEDFKKVQKYFVDHPDELEYEGKKLGESFNQYAKRTIDAHAKYENEPASTMLIDHSNNMMIMDAYRKNGGVWNDKSAQDYLNTEKPEPATLVKNKNKENAIREQTTNEVGVRNETALRQGVGGQDTEPKEPTNEGGRASTKEEGKTEGKKEPRTVGVSHQSLKDIADKIGLEQPETGDVLSPEEYTKRGQELLKAGADPDQLEADFKKDGLINADRISVAKAQYVKLVKDASDAYESKGKNSLEYKKAKEKADQWQTEVVKPMGTGFGQSGRSLQGETDIDTGSFVSMSRAFKDKYGKEPNAEQEKQLKEVSDKVRVLNKKVSDLEQKLTEAIDKSAGESKIKATYKEKAKAVADSFRKLKTKPFTFKDENGNEINVSKMGLDWNDVVEAGAKIIEKTGEIADGIAAALEKIKYADWYKGLSTADKDRFAQQLQAHYEENAPEIVHVDLAERLEGKKDSKFDPKDAKDIWAYAKSEYLRKGSTFDQMISGVSVDLGLSQKQVREAITSPKGTRIISDEMYLAQHKEQQAVRDARITLEAANQSKFERNYVVRFAKSLPSVWFTLKTFGHGTVGFVTHSGMNIFTPSAWKTFWPNFAKQFKFAFGGTTKKGLAAYQQEMTDLVNKPRFAFWKRNGLAVDPVKSYDDYQQFQKHIAKIGEMGDRGFNALKLQRYDLAEKYYNGLSAASKADPKTAKEIASIVNHSTGTADIPVPKAIGTAIFAPRLEAARWSKLLIEPAKAVKTLYNWKEATPAEKVAATITAKRAGEMFAVYMSGLAANSAALALAGSTQKINYTDPSAYDFLKFKAGDKTLDVSGGMLSMMHFLGSLVQESIGQRKKVRGVEEARSETMMKSTGNYVRGKLSPIASTVADITSQADYAGRPLPFSSDKGTKFKPKYTWPEYIEDQQLPIPVSEAFKVVHDQMRDSGVPEANVNEVLSGIVSGAVSGATGGRIGVDYKNDKKDNNKKATGETVK